MENTNSKSDEDAAAARVPIHSSNSTNQSEASNLPNSTSTSDIEPIPTHSEADVGMSNSTEFNGNDNVLAQFVVFRSSRAPHNSTSRSTRDINIVDTDSDSDSDLVTPNRNYELYYYSESDRYRVTPSRNNELYLNALGHFAYGLNKVRENILSLSELLLSKNTLSTKRRQGFQELLQELRWTKSSLQQSTQSLEEIYSKCLNSLTRGGTLSTEGRQRFQELLEDLHRKNRDLLQNIMSLKEMYSRFLPIQTLRHSTKRQLREALQELLRTIKKVDESILSLEETYLELHSQAPRNTENTEKQVLLDACCTRRKWQGPIQSMREHSKSTEEGQQRFQENPGKTSHLLPPDMSELRVVLLGNSWPERSKVGNFILGADKFSYEEEPDCCITVRGKLDNKDIVLINTPNLLLPNTFPKGAATKCSEQCQPGPHAFLLVLQPEDLTKEQQQTLCNVLTSFSHQSFHHSLILILTPREETPGFMETYRQHPPLKEMITRCKYRFLWWKDLEHAELSTRMNEIVTADNLSTDICPQCLTLK